jgi:hypothetical protein
MNMNTKEKLKVIEKKLIVFLKKYRTNTEQNNEQSRFNTIQKRTKRKS